MKAVLTATFVACALLAAETPKIHLVFENWLSVGIIVALVLGFVVWVTYIATSVARIKRDMSKNITKTEFAEAFERFRRELKA